MGGRITITQLEKNYWTKECKNISVDLFKKKKRQNLEGFMHMFFHGH